MNTKRKKSGNPIYRRLIALIKSKRARCIGFFIIMIYSILAMFCIDQQNYIRETYLPFLSENIVSEVMALFAIERYNVTSSSWVLFSSIMTVCLMLLIGNIIAPKYIEKKVRKRRDLFSSESKVKVFYTTLFYGVLLLLSAGIILTAYFLNAFVLFRANTVEKSPFVSLITMLLIFIGILLSVPVALLIVYFALKLVLRLLAWVFGYFFASTVSIGREIAAAQEEKKSGSNELNTVFLNGGKPETPASDDIFPSLTATDEKYADYNESFADDITLGEFVKRFQSFAIHNHKIYYELPLLRQFVAGLASSRLIILEGLSGTGKSMLPRMFKEFTGSDALFTPVQATWRDKTDVLGFYSEFTGTFKSTAFLDKLYEANYSDKVNLFILDEMNLSRVEYYFADFLSVMEYPEEDWKIKAYLPFDDRKLPAKLENGFIQIPSNSWFIGTANTDDSTYTITDKVCDRAIILNFEDRFARMESDVEYTPTTVSATHLKTMFNEAINNAENRLNESDLDKFNALCEYVKDRFDILFGNRIMVQIEKFVPIYVALGGTKEEALDFMFAKKILRKLEGRYDAYLKDELVSLTVYLENAYGKGVLRETERFINKTIKKLV